MIDVQNMTRTELVSTVEAWIDQRGKVKPTGDAASARAALGELDRRLHQAESELAERKKRYCTVAGRET
jgi:hypothetical protein